jgi:UDP-N-acetylmuramoylalanine--D-glutamate ligase
MAIVILGAGESGVGAAILAQTKGFDVFVSELGQIAPAYLQVLEERQIPFEQGGHRSEWILEQAHLVIKSPGIPDKAPLIQALKAKGTPIIDEIEFAARYTKAKIIAITGSNGKTTTTRLAHHLLQASGLNAYLAGNVGYSFAKQVALSPEPDYYVLEVSSFQLDGCYAFQPHIAVLLNITPDHLDRYNYRFEDYIASKFRIVQNKRPEDYFIYGADSPGLQQGLSQFYQAGPQGCLPINMADFDLQSPHLAVPFTDWRLPIEALPLKGRHNLFNMAAAALVAKLVGLSREQVLKALTSFQNEDHRLQTVAFINQVEYINDSKATNVDAVFYALEAMTKPTVWIVGGQDKGNDYSPLFPLVQNKVRAIVCLGKDNRKIIQAFQTVHPIIEQTHSVSEALKVASLYAEPGDAVLLSPACASFDLFQNYKDRGQQFMQVILQQAAILRGEAPMLPIEIRVQVGRQADQQSDQ